MPTGNTNKRSRTPKRRLLGVGLKVSHCALGFLGGKPISKKPRPAGRRSFSGIQSKEAYPKRFYDEFLQAQVHKKSKSPSVSPKRHMQADKIGKDSQIVQSKPNSFLDKMRLRLSGGQFRMLNERLYTCSGQEAFKMFKEDPNAFQCYHAGYQEQMHRWPCQPVDAIVDWLRARSAALVVADFGCGDGRLAKSVKNQVFSLDLVASDATIIACNMAHTPLTSSSVDVAVFCLSLMGTDYSRFLVEAHRVLKSRGWLIIAEVKSRFDPETGGTDPKHFIEALETLGFTLTSQDFSNKMFIIFQFVKQGGKALKSSHCNWPTLKACIYKRR